MNIIKQDAAAKPAFYDKGKSSALRNWVNQLEVGDTLQIPHSDWGGKRAPYYIVNYLAKTSGRTFRQGRLPNKQGWVVVRLS